MRIVKQLSIFLKNRPGTLADVCTHLLEEGINILGLSVSDTVDHAVVRLVVDEPMRATHSLGNAGVLVVENDIIVLELKNEPGQLVALSNTLGGSGVNIEYAYGGLTRDAESGVLYLRVSDPKSTLELLSEEF